VRLRFWQLRRTSTVGHGAFDPHRPGATVIAFQPVSRRLALPSECPACGYSRRLADSPASPR
jgi:hypothetical protein